MLVHFQEPEEEQSGPEGEQTAEQELRVEGEGEETAERVSQTGREGEEEKEGFQEILLESRMGLELEESSGQEEELGVDDGLQESLLFESLQLPVGRQVATPDLLDLQTPLTHLQQH